MAEDQKDWYIQYLCKSLERQLNSTQEKLDYANQQLFGDRRQKVRKKTADGKPKKTDSVDNNQSQDIKGSAKKERDFSNRPDGYKTIGTIQKYGTSGLHVTCKEQVCQSHQSRH